jgi:hypothetical protein
MTTNTVNNNNNENTAEEIQNYIDSITKQYKVAESYIEAMEADGSQITHDQKELDKLLAEKDYFTRYCASVPSWITTEISRLQADENGLKADIATQKSKLEALDPSFASLDDTLASLLNAITNLSSNSNIAPSDMSQDIQHIQNYLNLLFSSMKQKLNSDKDAAIISNDVQDNLSDAQLEQFAAQMITSQEGEQNTLGQLTSLLGKDIVSFHQAYDNAKADKHRFNCFDKAFNLHDANGRIDRDNQIMANASSMIDTINNALTALAPETASLMPEFVQVTVILKIVMEKLKKILDNADLSSNQKASGVLSVLMFALGVFNMVGQEVQEQKSHNEKKMAESNINASQMNMADTVMNQQIQEEEAANAKLMKAVSLATQIILGAIMVLTAPGVGTALLMATFTALEATGVMDQATQKLGDVIHSQIAAEVLIGVAEILVTCGGGYVGDEAVSNLSEEAVATAVEIAEEVAAEAIQKAAEQAAVSSVKAEAVEAAEATIKTVVKKAAKAAAKRTAEQLFNQPIIAVMKMLMTAAGRDAAKEVVIKAATEAADTAIVESATVAKLAARGVQSSNAILTEIADRAGNKAAANVANVSEKDVEALARSQVWKSASRLSWTILFNISSSDYLTRIAKTTGNDNFLTFMEVLKQLMQMIALLGGSGMLSAATFDGGANSLLRIANGLSLIPQGANTVASYGQYQTAESQAKATTALARNQTIASLLHTYLKQMQKDIEQERDRFIRQQQQELQSDRVMAGHLNDGDMAGIQVLMASAG